MGQQPSYLPRIAELAIESARSVQPVVVLMGARQVGKSTLVQNAAGLRGHHYRTLDALDVRDRALQDPVGLIRESADLVLDEVQRAPDLLIAVKQAVDLDRRPGRFVLTGSANLLAMRRVKETLAGRASYVTLWPLSRRERLGTGRAGCWDDLVARPLAEWGALLEAETAPAEPWREVVRRSAYPPVVRAEWSEPQQADWLQGYLDAYVTRDVPELSSISRPLDLLRLMRAAAATLGHVEHQAGWARSTGLASSTLSRWVDLLEMSYQLVRVPAFSSNRTKRLTRAGKVYWSDTALALHLAGNPEPTGAHLENLVLADLQIWASSRTPRPTVMHWRTAAQQEVDFVVELPGGRLMPIEVKASPRPTWRDVAGLTTFVEEYRDLVHGGLVLHGGDETYALGDRLIATPWWRVI